MLSFNRTFTTTMLCLLAMLLTGFASSVRAAKVQIEALCAQEQKFDLQQHQRVNKSDCVESHHSDHLMEKGQQAHTSCSSLCIVKMPINLLHDDLMLLPHQLALIDKSSTPKAVAVVYKTYRPPIV
ncbi:MULTISPECIES: hypothetical protein [Vibrio]|jgi:hypothetical protein|uniref:hypothetical protein n=1 Tax=Vibrio TaxID=662 RepID=UPI000BFFC8D0|nr:MULTISPECIES: hypothetical protein [unclassified Vibrio]PHJ42327.1 hypothetical protein AK965_07460 [Vibrio sp. PID17_43]RIZ53254.1 hypothetical protein AK966_13555 [Vibrio sp. PID23_8]